MDPDRPEDLERGRNETRLEIVQGLLDALARWDELSAVIGAAADRGDAVASLTGPQFGYPEQIAHHVLDMRVVMRTAAARKELEDEQRDLAAKLGR